MKTIILLALPLLFMTGCASTTQPVTNRGNAPDMPRENAIVEIETTKGVITLELDGQRAPISVANFLEHARQGHYNGTIFHRVMPNFVVQGGGWTSELVERAKVDAAAGHADTPIKNEWQNGLKNVKYSIAMARESDPDTATREFYINVADNARLDTARTTTGNAGYAVFGKVTKGFEVVEAIRIGETGPRNVPGVTDGSMENVPLKPVTVVRVKVIK